MREYRRELRDMKSRVGERPYLFEQVTQVIDRKGKKMLCSLYHIGRGRITFFHILPADQRKGSGGADVQEQVEQGWFGRAVCGGKGGGGRRINVLRMQTREIFIAGMHPEFLVVFNHPRCNTAASGKRMNSAAARGSQGLHVVGSCCIT